MVTDTKGSSSAARAAGHVPRGCPCEQRRLSARVTNVQIPLSRNKYVQNPRIPARACPLGVFVCDGRMRSAARLCRLRRRRERRPLTGSKRGSAHFQAFRSNEMHPEARARAQWKSVKTPKMFLQNRILKPLTQTFYIILKSRDRVHAQS